MAISNNPNRFDYVEGIAGGKGGPGGGPVWDFKPHAWLTPGDGRAVDVTWRPQQEPPSYFGVTFHDIEFVRAILADRGGYGLLGKDGGAEEIAPLLDLLGGVE
jgi:hypothetical protein